MFGFAWRNLFRNRLRFGLTSVGVAAAMITFLLLRTVISAWADGAEHSARDRVVTRNKVTFVMPVPKRYYEDTLTVPGVRVATYMNWFGGTDPNHDKEFFATMAVDPATFLKVYDEIKVPDADYERFKANRTGAVVGDNLARKLGWKVGDKVTLNSGIYASTPDKPWTFTIDGIYTTNSRVVDRNSLYFQWAYLNDSLPPERQDQVGWVVSRVNDPKKATDIAVAIDKLFDTKDIQTRSEDERSFNASFLAGISVVLVAINAISIAILVIMLLVLGNTIAMGVRERTNEYGVLRAIGFQPKHLVIFILSESVLTGLVGGLAGIALSYPIVEKGLGGFLEGNLGQFFPYFRMAAKDLVLAGLISLALGGVAGLFPARGVSKMKVTEALRRVA